MKNSINSVFDNLITYLDLNNNILKVNNSFIHFIGKNKNEIIGKKESDLLNLIHSSKKEGNIFPQIYDEIYYFKNETYYFKTKEELVIDKKLKNKTLKITRKDISEFKRYASLYLDNKKLLEYIATAKPIEFILDRIIKSVEKRNKDIICSILLLDDTKQKLIKGAAPSLPDFYNDKLNNMQIGEKVGSCGAAVFLQKRVIVEDISKHENWKYAKNLAAKINVKACWSQPFFSSSNEILGSFAIYYKKIKKPTEFDIHLIEDIAHITGIAVEKHNNYIKRKKDEKEQLEKEQILMHKTKQAMMGEMLENIAHQWRQPLSVISTYATGILMKKKYGIDTSSLENEAFENINLNAQYLSNTIDDFRKYFTIIKEKNSFQISTVLELTLKLLSSRIDNEHIKVSKKIKDITIISYENELIQVLMNILNNAIDILSEIENKENRYIYINSYKEDKNLIILINDSAKGADEKIIKRIFDPYFTTKKQNLGTGIGLYMCQEIIEKHLKGSISAQNKYFKIEHKKLHGLEFKIVLPSL